MSYRGSNRSFILVSLRRKRWNSESHPLRRPEKGSDSLRDGPPFDSAFGLAHGKPASVRRFLALLLEPFGLAFHLLILKEFLCIEELVARFAVHVDEFV